MIFETERLEIFVGASKMRETDRPRNQPGLVFIGIVRFNPGWFLGLSV